MVSKAPVYVSDDYRKNWQAIFGKKTPKSEEKPEDLTDEEAVTEEELDEDTDN